MNKRNPYGMSTLEIWLWINIGIWAFVLGLTLGGMNHG